MSDKTHKESKKSLKLVVIFVGIVLFVSLLSLSIRTAFLIGSRSFDGKHRFTIALQDSKNAIQIVSLDPQRKTGVLLALDGTYKPTDIEAQLNLPLDGRLINSSEMLNEKKSIPDLFWTFLRSGQTNYVSLNQYDLLRLFILSLQIPQKNIVTEEIVLKNASSEPSLKSHLVDKDLVSDDLTIGIVNATGTVGVGRKLELALETLGASVVAVTTAREVEENTQIYYNGTDSYTKEKIENIFNLQARTGGTQAADILIIIGKSSKNLGIFATL